MRLLRPGIRARLTATYAGLFFVLGAVLLAVAYGAVRASFDRATERRLVELESTLRAPNDPSKRVRVRIRPGFPEDGSPELRQLDPLTRRAYREARARLAAADTLSENEARQRVLAEFLAALGGLGLVSIVAGWTISGRALRPVRRISGTARRISERNLSERIDLGGPRDELRELADTFDGMLGRLEGAFAAQRRFVADASHELRTPLAIVRTELDVTLGDPDATIEDLRDMAGAVQEANARMERLIDALLALATSGAGALDRHPVDLAELVRGALADARLPVVLEADLTPAPLDGDAVLLERLVGNLLQNAGRYNAPGGWIRVRTRALPSGALELVVANPGAAVPPDSAEALFEPFRRLETSRARATGGSGLGLAVVRAVAEAHGGTAHAAARRGGGLTVTVLLPGGAGGVTPTLPGALPIHA